MSGSTVFLVTFFNTTLFLFSFFMRGVIAVPPEVDGVAKSELAKREVIAIVIGVSSDV